MMSVIDVRRTDDDGPDGEAEITVRFTYWAGWLWTRREVTETVTYCGSGTVWRNVQTGERPGTLLEEQLANALWLNDYRERRRLAVEARLRISARLEGQPTLAGEGPWSWRRKSDDSDDE